MDILIVDDSDEVRAFLKRLLSGEGHAVREAGNGEEGLARAREQRPDAIISDGVMPVMDGFQLLQALKRDDRLASIPFIFFSAVYTGQREQELAEALGADVFLVKPQRSEAILKALRDATAGSDKAVRTAAGPTGGKSQFAEEYSQIVATALEEKVVQLERVTRDLERTQKELRQSEAAYRGLFENNPQPMWVYDRETLAFLAVNDAAIASYGFSREEFLAMTIRDLRRPEDVQKLISRVAEAADGFDNAGTWKHRKKDGTIIDVEVTSHTLEFSGRRAKLILANDVTERRRMEKDIRHASDEWRATVDAMTEAVALLDADGRVVRCNKAMTVFVEKSYVEIIGRVCDELYTWFGGGRGELPFLQCKTTLKREFALLKKGDRWFVASADPIVDETGALQGAVHILQDITERKLAEEALRAGEERYRLIFQESPVGIFHYDAGLIITECNDRFTELLKTKREKIVGLDMHTLRDQRVLPSLKTTMAGKEGRYAGAYKATLSSPEIWVSMRTAPLYDHEGAVKGGVGIVEDITESKRAEDALKESENMFRSLTEQTLVGTYIIQDKVFKYVNPRFIEIFGYSAEELLGRMGPMHLTLKEDQALVEENIRKRQSGEIESIQYEFRGVRKDGQIIHIELFGSNIMFQGRYAVIGTLQDITLRKKAEEQVFQAKQDWEYTFNSITDMVTVHDANYNIIMANKAAEKILNLPILEKVKGRKCFAYYHGTDHAPEGCPSCSCLQTGAPASFELFEPHLNRFIEIRAIPRFDANNKLIGLIHVVRDITERKRAQDALNERVHQAALGAEIGVALTAGGDLRTVLQHCAEAMVRYLDAAFARIWTLNEKDKVLEMQASAGMYTHLNGPHGRVPVGKFKIGLIAEERKPHLTNEVVGDPRVGDQEWAKKEGMVAFAGYPLIVQDRLVGVMAMFSRKQLAETTMNSLGSVADVVALGIERKRAEESLTRYSEELTALNSASNTLMLTTNLSDIYQEICNIMYSVLDLKMVWLGIAVPDTHEVKPVAYSGDEYGYLSSIKVTWDESLYGKGPTGMAIKTKKSFATNIADPAFAPWSEPARQRGYVASLAVPLIYARDKCLGALNFYSDDPGYFSSDRIKLCEIFANQAAIAIENAGLVAGLETTVFERTRALEDTNIELQTLNKELELRREEADGASRSKTDFLANMSHELRTPLNAIMGFSEIMLMGMAGPVSDKQKEFLGDISQSGNHLLSLINDILDLSKVEAGKLELEPGLVNVAELISGSLMMFKEKALKHALTLGTSIDPAVPELVADRRMLKQVMVNLLSNACKFTPDGGSVRVSARRVQSSEDKVQSSRFKVQGSEELNTELRTPNSELDADSIEISVADTGIGISKEHQEKLFQPFMQIDSSLTRNHAGTGLGLSLCRRFIELHGGRIWVESEPGKGSTFRFVVPVRQGAKK